MEQEKKTQFRLFPISSRAIREATRTETVSTIQICVYHIGRGAVERLDAQVLFDPFEE